MEIIYEKKDRIAYITINRPEVMNAISPKALDELGKVWIDFREDDNLWVALVTGAGDKAFCAGADLKELIPEVTSGRFKLSHTMPAFLKNIHMYKPIVAAINGFCLAGGTELIQATDIRIAAEHATFSLAEPRWALFPAGGSTVRLPRQIPYCRAMEILLIGDRITAQDALQIGLINKIVKKEDLMPTAIKVAERICENGPLAVRAIKESVQKCFEVPIDYANMLETYFAREVFATEDAKEGPRAFLEKRKPVFRGK
jgi:enoyl-CoA hydratase